jgi:predicted negative regulator of RcsB-dependent stress response
MKAERRHELQENSLVRGIRNFPEFWRAYGSKVMLGVILVLLAILLVRMWANNKAEARRRLAEELTSARSALENFRLGRETADDRSMRAGRPPEPIPPETVNKRRSETWSKVDSAVSAVLKDSSDAAQQAEAKLLRADINYHFGLLASLSPPSSMKLDATEKEYLDRASQNYTDVVNQESRLSALQVASARFGLAAVAETQKDFAKAREQYEAIKNNSPDELLKRQAEMRLLRLSFMRTDLPLGPPKDPPKPSTVPTTTGPATATSGPATAPTTATATPATSPASAASAATRATETPATSPATQP